MNQDVADRLRRAGCVRAEDEAALLVEAAATPAALEALVVRRVAGEPIEQVVGWAEFAGIRVQVAPRVFVPRHRSEHLVTVAAAWLRDHRGRGARPTVVDLCAGSGALGLALHHRVGPFALVAVDLDPDAAACAARNLAPVGGTALLGDLFEPLPESLRGRVDLVVANAPYVPSAEVDLLPREAREHEPRQALDGGPDGLSVHRAILATAGDWLGPGAAVAVEVADRQVAALLDIADRAGLHPSAQPDPADRRTVAVVAVR